MLLIQAVLTLYLCATLSWGLEDESNTEDNSWSFHDSYSKNVLCSDSECTLTEGSYVIVEVKWDFKVRSVIGGPVLTVIDTNNVVFSNKTKYNICPAYGKPDLIEGPPCNFGLVNGTYNFRTESFIVPGIPEGNDEKSGDISFCVKYGDEQKIISQWPTLTVHIKRKK